MCSACTKAVVVGMADGYAQATRNASFVSLHSAAGVGNAMGDIFTAYKNRTPMVIMAGQQARSILPFDPFLFSASAVELPKPYVKWSVEPARADDVPAGDRPRLLHRHDAAARAGVRLDPGRRLGPARPSRVPHRVVSTELRPEPRRDRSDRRGARREPNARRSSSERPIDRDDGWDAVVELAERHNARVWGAPMAGRCGFPEDHRLFAGFLPPMREKIVSLLAGHDLIFAIGAPAFTYHVEGAGPHVPAGAKLCQLIDDPNIAAWTPVGVAAIGSIRLGVLDLLARPAPAPRPAPRARAAPPRVEPSGRISVAYSCRRSPNCATPATIIVEEAPSARPAMQAYLPITRSEGYFTMDSGGLGYGMPAAVGIALGKPGARVIGLIGDGSAMYSIQALWSAAQLGLPIAFIILNNRRYAALQDFAPAFGFAEGEAVAGTALPDIDFVALAKGMGCAAARVGEPGRLRESLEPRASRRRSACCSKSMVDWKRQGQWQSHEAGQSDDHASPRRSNGDAQTEARCSRRKNVGAFSSA